MATADKIKADIERMAERLAKAQAREALKANRDKAKQADAKRRADARAKIVMGGLVLKAGFPAEMDKGALLGGLLDLAKRMNTDPAAFEQFKRAGDKAMTKAAKS